MGKVVNFLERYVQSLALAAGLAYLLYMAYAYLGSELKLTDPPVTATIDGKHIPPGEVHQTVVDRAVLPLEAAMKISKDVVASVEPANMVFTVTRPDEIDRKPVTIRFKVGKDTTIRAAVQGLDWGRVNQLRSISADKLSPQDRAYLEKARAATLHFDDLKLGALVSVGTNTGVQVMPGPTILALSVTLESPIVENVQADYDKRLDEQKADLTAVALNTSSAYQAPGIGPVTPVKPPGPEGTKVVTLPIPPPAVPAAGLFNSRWTVTLTGPPDAAGKPTRQDKAVVNGLFTIDSAALTREMHRAYDAVPSRAPNMLDPEFSRLYVLREEWVDGKWGPPKLIDPPSLNKFDPYPRESADFMKLDAEKTKENWFKFKDWMERKPSQALILEPQFYPEPGDVAKTTRPKPGAPAGGAAPLPGAAAGGGNPAQIPPVVNAGGPAPVVNKDHEIVIYDSTVEEGKTYRYAARYRLFNAVFDHHQDKAEPADIHTIFDVPSSPDPLNEDKKASEADVEKLWSEPVTIEPTARIFVTKINTAGNQVGPTAVFVVFIWKDGHWKKFESRPVNPGDPVNAAGAGKSSTGWTVVDIRKDPHVIGGVNADEGKYVLIMDDHGTVTLRDAQSDAADKDFIRLKGLAGAPAAAAMNGP